MEHPPKQGLKLIHRLVYLKNEKSFNGTSTKTRIETSVGSCSTFSEELVLMEHPPKQGLKHKKVALSGKGKRVLMEHPPKQGLKPIII